MRCHHPRNAGKERFLKTFSLDPSSTVTGFSVIGDCDELIAAGVLTADKGRLEAPRRIEQMARDLRTLLNAYDPDEIVIEWVSKHVGKRRHKGRGAGLAIYGAAVGALWSECQQWSVVDYGRSSRPFAVRVVPVEPEVWTGGWGKESRVEKVASLYPAYDRAADTGGDIADAIALNLWYRDLERMKA